MKKQTIRNLINLADTLDAEIDVVIYHRDDSGSVIKKEIAPVSFINMEMNGRVRICTEKSRMNILK